MTLQAALYEVFIKNKKQAAIITNEYSVSYDELLKKINFISTYITNTEGFSDKIISLLFTNPEYYIYGVLGTLYSKNIFVPLDGTHPIDKLRDYFLSLECNFLLADKKVPKHIIDAIKRINVKVTFIEDIFSIRDLETITYNFQNYHEEDAIYIFFTSGSTGKPKAVLGMNKSLLHFIEWEKNEFSIEKTDIFAQMTSPAFDPYLRDIFTPLRSGAKILLVNRNILLVPRLFGDFLHKSKTTYLHTTPSILRSLMKFTFNKDYFGQLKYIISAGEILAPDIVKKWYTNYGNHTVLVNLYGPTETTLAKVFTRIPDDFSGEIVPVGIPINDTKIYIMRDNASDECNDGEIGEVYIETEYMTHGYYNDQEYLSLTNSINQKKCYLTGDLGYIKCGNLYLIGRKDEQKKIGGVRIDLNEIRSVILAYKKVKIENCVVLYEEYLLVLFYIASITINVSDMRKFLEEHFLPIHIPHRFIKINEFPISPNGKLDKNRLMRVYQDDKY